MEKTSKEVKEDIVREIASNPQSATAYITTIHTALELCHQVLYDLTWERGGKLDSWQEEYVITLNNIVSEILKRE